MYRSPKGNRRFSRRLVSPVLALTVLTVLMPAASWSRLPDPADLSFGDDLVPIARAPQTNDFGYRIHDVGLLALRISNVGVFGSTSL